VSNGVHAQETASESLEGHLTGHIPSLVNIDKVELVTTNQFGVMADGAEPDLGPVVAADQWIGGFLNALNPMLARQRCLLGVSIATPTAG
jgi:hypothetical protein